MLHSVMQKRQTRQYAFVNGFKNIAWLAGYIQRLGDSYLHIASGRPGVTFPVLIEHSPSALQLDTGQAVSLCCRVAAVVEGGRRVPILKALGMDRPSMINLTPREIFRMALEALPSQGGDAELPANLAGPLSNTVQLSGLLERVEGVSDLRSPALELLIKQHDKGAIPIPVRIQGKNLEQYRKRLRVGLPVFIEGKYRVKPDSRHDRLEPIIQTTDVRVPQRGKDMLTLPAWAFKFMSEHTSDPELRRFIDRMSSLDLLETPAGKAPEVIDEL